MTKHVNLRRVGRGQDLVHKVRKLLGTVLHLVKAIEDATIIQLTIGQGKHAVTLCFESRAHVEPVVKAIPEQAVDKDQSSGMIAGGLTVPVVPTRRASHGHRRVSIDHGASEISRKWRGLD